ncbi:MAG: hypothetical protein IJD97_11805 [Clostridia bacterium]|nr:hypothetical protein [Clostridia bacterium]
MCTDDLIYMMFHGEPLETFEKLLKEEKELEWGKLLNMCIGERSYQSVGGDYGDLENPPINHKKIKYLERLIKLLESNGIKPEEI